MFRTRISLMLAVAVVGSLVFFAPNAPQAVADGTPNISLSVSLDAETLHTDTTEVRLTASNPTGTDGFNLSYRVVLPAGVSFDSGPVTPTLGVDPSILFFENVSVPSESGNHGRWDSRVLRCPRCRYCINA